MKLERLKKWKHSIIEVRINGVMDQSSIEEYGLHLFFELKAECSGESSCNGEWRHGWMKGWIDIEVTLKAISLVF